MGKDCHLPANNENCYTCYQAGHKAAHCPGASAASEPPAPAASSPLGGVASGSGKCKCGNQTKQGLTMCSPCANGVKKSAQQNSSPVGLNPTGSASTPPAPARSAWKSAQALQEERMQLVRDTLKVVEENAPEKRRLALQALNNKVTPEYVLEALFMSDKYCMLGSACVDERCRKQLHSLSKSVDVYASAVSAASASHAKTAGSTRAAANNSKAGSSQAAASSQQPAGGAASGISVGAGTGNHNHGSGGGRGGRGGRPAAVGRSGPASGHGGELNGGAQSGGVSSASSSASSSPPVAAVVPAASAAAPALISPNLELRVSGIELSLQTLIDAVRALTTSAQLSAAPVVAAAPAAQQNAAASQ